ncbi:hypothetical protein [Mycobacterium sp. 236(2023)]|uniref:NACHT domain-containing protein n=1 Tax=Mycobacterium sp. 236(2023) TaxID=3038163 RepID=UPI002414EAC3|nr:hypothetical protein [Mycobacterium sp. 236(2023)]MDG4666370.1 hypothetical protein [Mycobacterium sp. 236(2023)]
MMQHLGYDTGGNRLKIVSGRYGAGKPATEQPGNSFRYLYWRLSNGEFQQLCGALLRRKYPGVNCYPVGMADRGVDARRGDIVYQVKWSSKLLQDPASWLRATIEDERDNLVRFGKQGVSEYILMTSVAGTTTANNTGTIQRLQIELDKYTAEFGIKVECWWQSDIDAEVDVAPDSIKFSYQEMLAGSDAIRYLMEGSGVDAQAAEMRTTLVAMMGRQWTEDSKIKFAQLDLNLVDLTELFVDVEASLVAQPLNAAERFSRHQNYEVHGSQGAAQYLLSTTAPLTYLLGVPGQGKSTLAQYVCQSHRAALMPGDMYGKVENHPIPATNPRLPIRVDLKDFATWLGGRDPFYTEDDDVDPKESRIKRDQRSLIEFLAALCRKKSGGRTVTVKHVHSVLDRYPCLLVFDGLDEIADAGLRLKAVHEINSLAMEMGGQHKVRTFQFIVTSRPNASGLAEPNPEIFQTLQLQALSPELQSVFVERWADLHQISGSDRTKLRKAFRSRAEADHVAQLADNPMQLTILLYLMHKHGESAPVGRTELYTHYVETLLSREINKDQIAKAQANLVQQATAFLGWHIQSGVEIEPSMERLTKKAIENAVILYLREIDGPWQDVPALVSAATDRLWALSSKVDGTFEFAVQPLKEFCAALFLSDYAGLTLPDGIPRGEMLAELIDRPYWLNTARYYAGFAKVNERAGLKYGLEEALDRGAHPLQQRTATWALLSDGIFAQATPVQRDVTKLLTDPLSVRLIADGYGSYTNFPPLANGNGGSHLAEHLKTSLIASPDSALSRPRAIVLRHHLQSDFRSVHEWWQQHLQTAIDSGAQDDWLRIGSSLDLPRLMAPLADALTADSPVSSRLALGCGATPSPEGEVARALLRNVLDGHCSDVRTSSTSEAGALLKAARPQWMLQLPDDNRHGPTIANEHLWMKEKDRNTRSSSFGLLERFDGEYARIKRAANARAQGQQGTTEPWQNLAREIAKMHGPCWLAAEIAVTGAANRKASPQGSFDPTGTPFGAQVDYGTLTMTVRRRPEPAWWPETFDRYSDELSRRTWSLALMAAGPEDVVIAHLGKINDVLTDLDADTYAATMASSSRIGISSLARRLSSDCFAAAANLAPRTLLMLSHFAYGLDSHDSMYALSDELLLDMAELSGGTAANWPVARELTGRMILHPDEHLMRGLRDIGPESWVEVTPDLANLPPNLASNILGDPTLYPSGWLGVAEYLHSQGNEPAPLREALADRNWVPAWSL